MRNAISVVAAVIALLVIVQPAAAAHTTVLSSHTTDTEFNNAERLENVSVAGSGDSASVELSETQDGSAVTRGTDTDSGSTSNDRGLRISTNTAMTGLKGSLSANSGGADTAVLLDVSKSVVETASVSGGDFEFTSSLSSGATYYVVVNASGATYTAGRNGSASFPYTGTGLDIESGVFEDSGTLQNSSSTAYAVNDLTPVYVTGRGEYISANHTGSRLTTGFTDLTLSDATAYVTWQYNDGTGWTDAASSTYTTSGNKSLNLPNPGGSVDTWRVNVTFEATGSAPTAELATEGIEFEPRTPGVDNSSASPSGGVGVSSAPTYEVNVSDGDFPTSQSDELTAEWYRNGTKLGETSVTANGTTTFTPSSSLAGGSQWHVEVTDEYGHTQSSDTFVYESPEELEIRNESNASELINGVDVTIEFYFPSATYTRNTTDGTVNMTGLPADQPFVVVAEAENYTNRRVYVPSLFETQTIYLLPTSAQSVSPEFELQDFSGDYPADVTVLEIQRVINGSWRTVEGDFFGATGAFPATLAYNQRHRLILTNTQTGESQNLGTYTPKTSTVQEITVYSDGEVTVAEGGVSATVVPSVRTLQSTAGQDVTATVRSPDDELSSWSVDVVLQNTSTGQNTTLNSTSSSIASGGNYTATMNLTNEAGNKIHVVVDYSTTDGVTGSKTVTYRIAKVYTDQFGLLQVLGGFGDHFPDRNVDMVLTLLAVVLSVLGMGAVSTLPGISTELVGLAGLLALGAFAVIGWITYGIVFAGAAGAATMVALRRVV